MKKNPSSIEKATEKKELFSFEPVEEDQCSYNGKTDVSSFNYPNKIEYYKNSSQIKVDNVEITNKIVKNTPHILGANAPRKLLNNLDNSLAVLFA